ncbi:fructosamine kinase [Cutibacterium acnes JCM 18916]|nr:fructosamine kinase [Cutibacterium acnes JCM 18916]
MDEVVSTASYASTVGSMTFRKTDHHKNAIDYEVAGLMWLAAARPDGAGIVEVLDHGKDGSPNPNCPLGIPPARQPRTLAADWLTPTQPGPHTWGLHLTGLFPTMGISAVLPCHCRPNQSPPGESFTLSTASNHIWTVSTLTLARSCPSSSTAWQAGRLITMSRR